MELAGDLVAKWRKKQKERKKKKHLELPTVKVNAWSSRDTEAKKEIRERSSCHFLEWQLRVRETHLMQQLDNEQALPKMYYCFHIIHPHEP